LLVRSYGTVAPLPVISDHHFRSERSRTGGHHFCGTILTLTRTGRYPATSPAVPGLSSPPIARRRDSLRYFICNYTAIKSDRVSAAPNFAKRQIVTEFWHFDFEK